MPKSKNTAQPQTADPTDRVKIFSSSRTRRGKILEEHTVSYWIGGKRKRRSHSILSDAEEDKGRTELLLASGDDAAANMPRKKLAIVSLWSAQLPPGVTDADVYRHYFATAPNLAAPAKKCPSVSALAEEVIAIRKAQAETDDKKLRNYQTLKSHLRRFAASFRKPLDQVTFGELGKYLAGRGAPKTQENHRISVLVLFNHARNHEHLPMNEKHVAERIARPEKGSIKRVRIVRPYTPEEFVRILAGTEVPMIPYMVIGGFGGVRDSERKRMIWKHWNAEERALVLPPEVTKGDERQVDLEPNLVEWMNAFAGKPDTKIQAVFHPNIFAGRVADAVGVERQHNGLRVSYCSYHVALFRSLSLTSINSGHSEAMLKKQYLRRVPKAQAEEWFAITPQSVVAFAKREGLPVPSWHDRFPSASPLALAA